MPDRRCRWRCRKPHRLRRRCRRAAVADGSAATSARQLPSSLDNSNVVQLSGRVKRWRNLASFATAAAAALIAMLGLQVYSPDLLPNALRPKVRTQVVEVKTPPLPAPPSAQYVAILQGDGGAPAFILTVDAATKNFTVRKVGADRRGRQEL